MGEDPDWNKSSLSNRDAIDLFLRSKYRETTNSLKQRVIRQLQAQMTDELLKSEQDYYQSGLRWCLKENDHDAHIWQVNGPEYKYRCPGVGPKGVAKTTADARNYQGVPSTRQQNVGCLNVFHKIAHSAHDWTPDHSPRIAPEPYHCNGYLDPSVTLVRCAQDDPHFNHQWTEDGVIYQCNGRS